MVKPADSHTRCASAAFFWFPSRYIAAQLDKAMVRRICRVSQECGGAPAKITRKTVISLLILKLSSEVYSRPCLPC